MMNVKNLLSSRHASEGRSPPCHGTIILSNEVASAESADDHGRHRAPAGMHPTRLEALPHPRVSLHLRADAPIAALLAPAGLADGVTICRARALHSITSFKETTFMLLGTVVHTTGCSALRQHSSTLLCGADGCHTCPSTVATVQRASTSPRVSMCTLSMRARPCGRATRL